MKKKMQEEKLLINEYSIEKVNKEMECLDFPVEFGKSCNDFENCYQCKNFIFDKL